MGLGVSQRWQLRFAAGMFIWLVYWFSGREWAAGRNKYLREFWHLPARAGDHLPLTYVCYFLLAFLLVALLFRFIFRLVSLFIYLASMSEKSRSLSICILDRSSDSGIELYAFDLLCIRILCRWIWIYDKKSSNFNDEKIASILWKCAVIRKKSYRFGKTSDFRTISLRFYVSRFRGIRKKFEHKNHKLIIIMYCVRFARQTIALFMRA